MHPVPKSAIRRAALFGGACMMLAPGMALAQQAAPAPTSRPAATQVEEIMVTAQRRSERLQDVPITVVPLTHDDLANKGLSTMRDLTGAVPSVVVALKGGFLQPVVRGISTQGTAPGLDPAVATYIDGMYLANTGGGMLDLADVDRIDILKGPQGTLFGRNATGGAIQITTRNPTYDFTGNAGASYGSYNDAKASLFLSGPLYKDLVAGSFSYAHHSNDGYVKDILHGGHTGEMSADSLRGKLAFDPTDWAHFLFTVGHIKSDDKSAFSGNNPNGNTQSRFYTPGKTEAFRPWESALDAPVELNAKIDYIMLHSSFDTPIGTLSVLDWRNVTKVDILQDSDYGAGNTATVGPYNFDTHTYSNEINLVTKKYGAFSAVTGLFFYHDKAEAHPLVLTAPSFGVGNGFLIDNFQTTKAQAVYGEVNFQATSRLLLIAGVRYSEETKEMGGATGTFPLGSIPAGLPRPLLAKKTWSSSTPRFSARYTVTDNINAYVTYSEGFKSGGYNSNSLVTVPVNPETNKAWEVGVKTSYDRFHLNVAAFNNDYRNLQIAALFGARVLLTNAAAARSYGIDADGDWQVTDSFKLSAGLSLLNAHYLNFKGASTNIPKTPAQCALGPAGAATVWPCGNVSVLIDASGNPIIRAPETTATLSADYHTAALGGVVRVNASGYYNSGFSWEAGNRVRQGAYSTLAGALSWETVDGRTKVSLWGTNLTNEAFEQSESDAAAGDGVSWAPPRFVGVSIGYRF